MPPYELSVDSSTGETAISFENRSKGFIEVVFTINGKKLVLGDRGYCFPPGYKKAIPAKLARGSVIKAYVYEGEGEYSYRNIDRPAYLRKGEKQKAVFKRKSEQPTEILEVAHPRTQRAGGG